MTIRQALLLVGGRGTRMSPLTVDTPKGLLPVAGLPFLDLQLRQLSAIGIDRVLLAVGTHQLGMWERYADERPGVDLVVETEPLDTAGPVRQALELLDDQFMVLNGDVVIEADLGGYLSRLPAAAEATLALVEVDDTSAYGVVVLDADGMVEAFVEKPRPEDAPARTVNAGMYVMSRTAIERYPAGRLSFERVVFPDLAARDALGGVVIEGRWMDIGTPDLYLDCTGAVLRGETALYRPAGPHLCDGEMAGDTAGAWSWVAAGASVAAGAVIEEAVVLAGARIGTNSVIRHAVVGWDAVVGSDVLIGGGAMVGRAARIGAGTELGYGIRIAPAATIGPGDVTFSPPK